MTIRETTQAFDLASQLGDLYPDGPWEGSASEVLDELAARVPEQLRSDNWPRNGKVLSGQLRAERGQLHEAGTAVRFRKIGGGRRLITITCVEADQPWSPPVAPEMRHSDVAAHLYILAMNTRG